MSCPKEIENYIKLQQLLSHGNQTVKKIFANAWKENYGKVWVDSQPSNDLIQFEKKIFNANRSQIELIKIGNSKDWDISVFAVIFSTAPFSKSKYVPYIMQIKDVRNKVNYFTLNKYYRKSLPIYTILYRNLYR